MPATNLAPVGFDVQVQPEGTVTVRKGRQPLIVPLAERHDDNNVIGQNLRSALGLIDAGVVRLVGVGQYTPVNTKALLAEDYGVRRAGSIAAYGQSIREANDGSDDGVIATIRACPNDAPKSFARYPIPMRSAGHVVGVEDPALRAEAQRASEAVAGLFRDEPDEKEQERKRVRSTAQSASGPSSTGGRRPTPHR